MKAPLLYGPFPSPEAVLSFHQLVENSDESFLLDNEALYDICSSDDSVEQATATRVNTKAFLFELEHQAQCRHVPPSHFFFLPPVSCGQ